MATKIEEMRWKLYNIKFNVLLCYGVIQGKIFPYDDELIENLRHVNYGGVPASILLLCEKFSNGYCYDRGTLVTLGFGDDDFRVVDADVDILRLNPQYIDESRGEFENGEYANHCFAERKLKNGMTVVYDTSLGLVFEKNLYYKMQNPKITKINDRETTLKYLYDDFQKDSDIERDKYALPLILPWIEKSLVPTQPFYLEKLKKEIEILKQEVGYDDICKEMHDDMKANGFLV
jgi:hypothetical protein